MSLLKSGSYISSFIFRYFTIVCFILFFFFFLRELPGPELEPMSPALAGEFLTTVPPGKPHTFHFSYTSLLSVAHIPHSSTFLCLHIFSNALLFARNAVAQTLIFLSPNIAWLTPTHALDLKSKVISSRKPFGVKCPFSLSHNTLLSH